MHLFLAQLALVCFHTSNCVDQYSRLKIMADDSVLWGLFGKNLTWLCQIGFWNQDLSVPVCYPDFILLLTLFCIKELEDSLSDLDTLFLAGGGTEKMVAQAQKQTQCHSRQGWCRKTLWRSQGPWSWLPRMPSGVWCCKEYPSFEPV